MKVEFLKNHNGRKTGEVHDLPDNTADYLIRTNAVKKAGKSAELTKVEKGKPVEKPVKEQRPVKDMDMASVKKETTAAPVKGKK